MGKWVELPKFTLCCFCIPLKPGLLAWALVLMLTQIIMLIVTSSQISAMNSMQAEHGPNVTILGKDITIAFLVLIILDIISGAALILSVLRALDILFKGYFYYSILSLVTHFILVVTNLGLHLFVFPKDDYPSMGYFFIAILNYGGRGLLEILIKLYMVLIVKSAISEKANGIESRA